MSLILNFQCIHFFVINYKKEKKLMYHVHMVYFFLSSAFEEKNTKILPEDNCKTRKYTRLETGYSIRDAFLIYQVEKK